jgi:cobalt-zinc-cadmium resistance protein CzcA
MLGSLVKWAVENRLVVVLLTITLAVVGGYAFIHINVEAYPDPAPAIIEVIAQYPGASAEEVERQVTIPLEVALAGMPGLDSTRSKSLFGLAHLRNQFDYQTSYKDARIEVLNRLSLAELPAGVQPEIAPTSPVGEIYRYILKNRASRMWSALEGWSSVTKCSPIPTGCGATTSRSINSKRRSRTAI